MLGLVGASRRLCSLKHACALLDSAPTAAETLSSSLTSLLSLGHLHTAAAVVELSKSPSAATAAAARHSLLASSPAAAANFACPINGPYLLARPGSMTIVAEAMERLLRASSPAAASAPHAQLGRLCGRPLGVADEEEEGEIGVWQADSVRRKRKKKMNKHKHAKRRKLNRHRR